MSESNTAEEIVNMSSEEIADEIQREAIEEYIPHYAAMIECYADKVAESDTAETLDRLKEEVRGMKGERDATYLRKRVLKLIEEASDE